MHMNGIRNMNLMDIILKEMDQSSEYSIYSKFIENTLKSDQSILDKICKEKHPCLSIYYNNIFNYIQPDIKIDLSYDDDDDDDDDFYWLPKPDDIPPFIERDECPLDDSIKLNDSVPQLGCGNCRNVFSQSALEEWLLSNPENTMCPMCRCTDGRFYKKETSRRSL